MVNTLHETAEISAEQKKTGFNFNKLQAIICMAASAGVSLGLIVLAVKTYS